MIKKCLKCGAMVEVIDDCTCENCGIRCCGEPMVEVKANSVQSKSTCQHMKKLVNTLLGLFHM